MHSTLKFAFARWNQFHRHKLLCRSLKKCKTQKTAKFIRSAKNSPEKDRQHTLSLLKMPCDFSYAAKTALLSAIPAPEEASPMMVPLDQLVRETLAEIQESSREPDASILPLLVTHKAFQTELDTAVKDLSAFASGTTRKRKDTTATAKPSLGKKQTATARSHGRQDANVDLSAYTFEDADDYDTQAQNGLLPVAQKNRPGQRARQLIWEKKYGEKAKHLVKLREKHIARKQEKEKVVDESLHPSWAAKKRGSAGITAFQGNKIVFGAEESSAPTVKKQKVTEEALHPSWTAKKNAQAGIKEFQGSKIIFD
ncbi:MAG: hypothetical protein SGCHY_001269 [Lobulomycetales sp.]